jgi:hypothetical protein
MQDRFQVFFIDEPITVNGEQLVALAIHFNQVKT